MEGRARGRDATLSRMHVDSRRKGCLPAPAVRAGPLGRLGWSGPWREMVAADIDFLVEKGRRSDGFFVHRFDYRGAVFDGRADLYDQVHAARFRP